MSVSTGSLSLADFTAYELPTKKWMKLIRPRMRLRVRVQNRHFISSAVTVDDQAPEETTGASVHWPWNDDERPSFADDTEFEVEIQRRFLLGYKCIRRTRPVTIDQVRTGDHCALALYDGQHPPEMPEDAIVIGEVTFTLRNDACSVGVSFPDRASSAYS